MRRIIDEMTENKEAAIDLAVSPASLKQLKQELNDVFGVAMEGNFQAEWARNGGVKLGGLKISIKDPVPHMMFTELEFGTFNSLWAEDAGDGSIWVHADIYVFYHHVDNGMNGIRVGEAIFDTDVQFWTVEPFFSQQKKSPLGGHIR